MPTGHDFSIDEKTLIFKVINFCEQEKTGPIIPLNNLIQRVSMLLGICERSVNRMKKKELNELIEQEKQKQDEEDKENENKDKYQLRNGTKSDSTLKHRETYSILARSKRLHRSKRHIGSITASVTQASIPKPYSSKKKGQRDYLYTNELTKISTCLLR